MTDHHRNLIAALRGRVYFRTSGRLWFCTVCGQAKKVATDITLDEFNDVGWKFLDSHRGCEKLED